MKQKAILYIRVSTDEQANGNSLAYQDERLRKYCELNNIEVVALYSEDHSAKTFERPSFKKLLAYIKKNRNNVDLLLFLKWDRFSRNAADAYMMINQLNRYNVEPQAIEQPLDLRIPEHKFMLAIYLAAPEVENDRRSLNISDGLHKAMKEGRWMGPIPKGYKRSWNEQKKAVIVPSEQAPIIVWLFEQVATGLYHIDQLRGMAAKKGLKVKRSTFYDLFRNLAYIGKIRVPAYKVDPEMIVDAKHPPIVSEKLFYQVQDLLYYNKKKKNKPDKHTRREELPLRGHLTCRRCGGSITGSASKGNGGRYFYYHCRNSCKERFIADLANKTFCLQLTKTANDEKLHQSLQLILQDANKTNGKEKIAEVNRLRLDLETGKKRLENAQLLMLDGGLDRSEYTSIKNRLEPEIKRIERELASLEETDPEESRILEHGFFFLRHLNKLFDLATLEEKSMLLGSTFVGRLHVDEEGLCRTNSDDPLLQAIFSPDAGFRQIKNGSERKFSLPSGGVETTGLEPATWSLKTKYPLSTTLAF
jgi:site-specific DNA recombinase